MSIQTMEIDRWERLAGEGRNEEAIVEFVSSRDWVTFTELQSHFAGFLETGGTFSIDHPKFTNIIFWSGMSEEFAGLILGLMQSGRVHLHAASPLSYMIDGGILQLPLAKSGRHYKKPHWLPACLRTVPLPRGRK